MLIRVLGAGAGGGFPQWNCNCDNCRGIRRGTLYASARTQSSIAVSSDWENWALFNASPDIRAQLLAFEATWPRHGVRDSGIKAIILIDSQIDHTTGLLMLRESTVPLEIYCSEPVRQDLTSGFPVFDILSYYCGVHHHPLPLDGSSFEIPAVSGLRFTAHALRSKAPPYSPHRHDPHPGDNVGVIVEQVATGRKLYYAPGLAEIEPHVQSAMEMADCVLVDGTFWREDEMVQAGINQKLAQEMGHLPQSGKDGMLAALSTLPDKRKVLIHINNTNPILDERSEPYGVLADAGIEVAHDGMEIDL